MHILVLLIAYFSRSKKNGDIFVPPHPDRSKTGVPYAKWERDGRRLTRRNVQSIIPIVASMKNMPKESKKPKEASLHPSDQVIRIDWQHKVNLSSIADFKHSRALVVETYSKMKSSSSALPQKTRRPLQHKIINSSRQVNELAFHVLNVGKPRPITNCKRMHTEWKRYG